MGGCRREEGCGMKDGRTTEDGLEEKKDEGMRSGPPQDDRTKNEWMTPQGMSNKEQRDERMKSEGEPRLTNRLGHGVFFHVESRCSRNKVFGRKKNKYKWELLLYPSGTPRSTFLSQLEAACNIVCLMETQTVRMSLLFFSVSTPKKKKKRIQICCIMLRWIPSWSAMKEIVFQSGTC